MVGNYYHILGVAVNASDDQIKKAYKTLALKYHPDKNKDPGAEEKFKEIAEAYEVLRDKDKRRAFDRYGNESSKRTQKFNHGFRDNWFSSPSDPFDLFRSFFGDRDPFSFSDQFYDPFTFMFQRHMQVHRNFHNRLHHNPLHQLTNIFNSDPFFNNMLNSPMCSSRLNYIPPVQRPHTGHVTRTNGPSRTIEIKIERGEESSKNGRDCTDKQDSNVSEVKKERNIENKENKHQVQLNGKSKAFTIPGRTSRNLSAPRKLSINEQQSLNTRLTRPSRCTVIRTTRTN